MALSNDLFTQFAKVTKDDKKTKKVTTVYGTVKYYNGQYYLQIDGSEILTPTITTADVHHGERVTAQIDGHSVIITGNMSSPAARTEDVQNIIIDTEKIDKIETDNIEINKRLEAVEAEIENLDVGTLTAEDIEAVHAAIDSFEAIEADIEKLTTDKLDAETADLKYANINFSNIEMAAVESLFTKSGIINNLVVGDTSITGELVGVTIKGDLIKGNTIAAEKLVIKGEDGIYYKLNTDGIKVEAEQTDYNSLNGSIITAKSITASKVNVTDLVAFGATIGGFKLTENSIYSGAKTAVDNTTNGLYLGNDGQIAIGDGTNYIKYYKDQNGKYKLDISGINALSIRLDAVEANGGSGGTGGSGGGIVVGGIIGYDGDYIPEGYEEVEVEDVTDYMNFSSSGLVIGDMKAGTLGNNVIIGNNNVDIRSGTTTLASFRPNNIYLGKNSETSVIDLCNGAATMRVKDDTDFRIYTDKRLVMSAYDSALIDCWRDSTHMTRIAIQSSDPDNISRVGGVQFTIYQDKIQNTVQMLGNDIIHKVTDGTNETYTTMHESWFKVNTSGTIVLNSKAASVQIGDSSSYSFGLRIGSTYSKAKGINCYWIDGDVHDLINQSSNGQASYFGPADIDEETTTNVRGKTVRLYCHSGGGIYLGASGSTAITSDRNMKKDITDIDDKYINFFDRLRPITYKYNEGHRDHVGFIAQEVEEALEQAGLTTEQFAGLIIEQEVTLNPNYDSSLTDEESAANEEYYDKLYSLRYEEFISLLVKKVQNLQAQINELKGE